MFRICTTQQPGNSTVRTDKLPGGKSCDAPFSNILGMSRDFGSNIEIVDFFLLLLLSSWRLEKRGFGSGT